MGINSPEVKKDVLSIKNGEFILLFAKKVFISEKYIGIIKNIRYSLMILLALMVTMIRRMMSLVEHNIARWTGVWYQLGFISRITGVRIPLSLFNIAR